jgi:hydrogenase maturation factor
MVDAMRAFRHHPLELNAAIVGRFEPATDGLRGIFTDVGGRRIIQKPNGEELPWIC